MMGVNWDSCGNNLRPWITQGKNLMNLSALLKDRLRTVSMMKTARVEFRSGMKDDWNEKAEETNHLE